MEQRNPEILFQKKIDSDYKIEPKDWMPPHIEKL